MRKIFIPTSKTKAISLQTTINSNDLPRNAFPPELIDFDRLRFTVGTRCCRPSDHRTAASRILRYGAVACMAREDLARPQHILRHGVQDRLRT